MQLFLILNPPCLWLCVDGLTLTISFTIEETFVLSQHQRAQSWEPWIAWRHRMINLDATSRSVSVSQWNNWTSTLTKALSLKKQPVLIPVSLVWPSQFTSAEKRKLKLKCHYTRTRIQIWRRWQIVSHLQVKSTWTACISAWVPAASKSLMKLKTLATPASCMTCSCPGPQSCLPSLPRHPLSRDRFLTTTSGGRSSSSPLTVATWTSKTLPPKTLSPSQDTRLSVATFPTISMSRNSTTMLSSRRSVLRFSKRWLRKALTSA